MTAKVLQFPSRSSSNDPLNVTGYVLGWLCSHAAFGSYQKEKIIKNIDSCLEQIGIKLAISLSDYFATDSTDDLKKSLTCLRDEIIMSGGLSTKPFVAAHFLASTSLSSIIEKHQTGKVTERIQQSVQQEIEDLDLPDDLQEAPIRDMSLFLERINQFFISEFQWVE